jgi:hypothetical protein
MKKIYLIDDNIDENRQKYGGGFVDDGTYQDVLIAIDKLSPSDDLSFVNEAACVLFHKSLLDYIDGQFRDGSTKVKSRLQAMPLLGDVIPFVKFSDGDTSDIGDYKNRTIYSLSKRALYSRLEAFVLHYQKTNEIELKILAYGQNYTVYLVDRAVTLLFNHLQEFENDEYLSASKVHCKEFEQIIMLSQPAIGKSYKDIVIGLQMNPITVREFKHRINSILDNFQDYGKNYYTWK